MDKMFKINDVSGKCGEVVDHAGQFLPYAHRKLGFNKPVNVNFVSDMENAKDPLGKTGYYDPNNMEITIFVDKRHVKDILRSLSHELVHHTQNCRGEFDNGVNTGPGYAQKDPHMRKMEAEAYLLGNGFLFRDWEDHLKLKESKKMAESSSKPDYIDLDGDGNKKETMKQAAQDKKSGADGETVDEGIFAPNHYCAHHGGVHMEGKIKLGKVIGHNWNEKLQKVTKYDMQFEDGTILEGVKAEDLYVTEASLAEMHHGHEAKEDDDDLEEGMDEGAGGEALLKQLAALKGKVVNPEVSKLLDAAFAKLSDAPGPSMTRVKGPEPVRKKFKPATLTPDEAPSRLRLREEEEETAGEMAKRAAREIPKKAKELQDKARAKKKAAAKAKKDAEKSEKNESWTRGNKDELLFERLVKKWAK